MLFWAKAVKSTCLILQCFPFPCHAFNRVSLLSQHPSTPSDIVIYNNTYLVSVRVSGRGPETLGIVCVFCMLMR